jgi:hypothetical protein
VHSRTCNVWILMYRGGVGLILVMFDVLDCYILYMCLLLFVHCIPVLEAPDRGGRQNMHFFKKNPYVRRGMWHQGGCGTTWRTFVSQKKPVNVRVLGSSIPHGRRT